eukprot:6185453-Pleurochrysis_carterae.AAC.1
MQRGHACAKSTRKDGRAWQSTDTVRLFSLLQPRHVRMVITKSAEQGHLNAAAPGRVCWVSLWVDLRARITSV